jgi:hypothetical protein
MITTTSNFSFAELVILFSVLAVGSKLVSSYNFCLFGLQHEKQEGTIYKSVIVFGIKVLFYSAPDPDYKAPDYPIRRRPADFPDE